jgi:hypothetical protein
MLKKVMCAAQRYEKRQKAICVVVVGVVVANTPPVRQAQHCTLAVAEWLCQCHKSINECIPKRQD